MDKVAVPPLSVPVPSVVAPSRNVTVPSALGVTVAVKVTISLRVEGLSDEVKTILEAVSFTTCETGDEVAVV